MIASKKNYTKQNLHPKNLHQGRYDLALLCQKHPPLSHYIYEREGKQTLDFSDSGAVINLNAALLKTHYNIDHWQIPQGYLCPPIPGRVDYIHYLADLLQNCAGKNILDHAKVKVIDIGTGASCIYPILGQRSYRWSFIASDIDAVSVASAKLIIEANQGLAKKIKVIHQTDAMKFFKGIIANGQKIDLTLCNPPFHSSLKEALAGNKRKRDNLIKSRNSAAAPVSTDKLNFGGQQAELFCQGGELRFIKSMISESQQYADQVLYFSALVSKSEHIRSLKKYLNDIKVQDVQVIKMSQGNKISRFIAWSFLNTQQRQDWAAQRLCK